MIINIRGTSGSGKSTLVRAIMNLYPLKTPIVNPDKPKAILGYQCEHPDLDKLSVVGKYETPCGGCDAIKTQDEAEYRVRRWSATGHVLFEGLLISHIYGRWAKVAKEHPPFRFVFLDTPLDVCIARVEARRRDKGNTAPLNATNTIQKWNDARRVFTKAKADGLDAMWLDGTTAAEEIQSWLK